MNRIIIKLLLVVLIFNFFYVLVHINHECTHDDNCPVCTVIKYLKNNILGLNTKVIEIVIINFIFIINYLFVRKLYDNRYSTLIGLKVEINS